MINPYWELIILLALINIIFALSLNIILGFNGQFSLGHAGFLALGTYTSGVITTQLIANGGGEPQLWHLLVGITIAIIVSLIGAIVIGYPCLRLRGDYLAIATLGFAEIIRIVLLSLPANTFGGPTGMQSVPQFSEYVSAPKALNSPLNIVFTVIFFAVFLALLAWGLWALTGMVGKWLNKRMPWAHWRWAVLAAVIVPLAAIPVGGRLIGRIFFDYVSDIFRFNLVSTTDSAESQQWLLFLIYLIIVGIITVLVRNYLNSVPGRAAIAIREDEIASMNLGINNTWMKLQNFMFGCALAGLSGALFAHTTTLFKPDTFNLFKSVDVLLMVVLGGMGSMTGSFVGAISITALPEVLRFLGDWRMVIYSLVLILFMIFRPGGLLGTYEIGELVPFLKHLRIKQEVPRA